MNKSIETTPLLSHPILHKLQMYAQKRGGTLYLVGGAVRDYGRTGNLPTDLDIMGVNLSSKWLAEEAAHEFNGRSVLLDDDHGIYRVILTQDEQGTVLDLSDALENDVQTDLARRDLTVNAMAVDLDSGEFLDPFNGLEDLTRGHIRMLSRHNLLDDPLRMIRVFRIGAKLQANTFDAETLATIKSEGPKILNSAAERIHVELLKLLAITPCASYLNQMADTGLLEVILPELTPMREIPPSGYHHLDLLTHTMELVNQAEVFLAQLPKSHQETLTSPRNGITSTLGIVKFACLLHDIGKPDTMVKREDGKVTFYGHDKVSEDMTAVLCRRLKLSKDITRLTQTLVRWHLYPCHFGPESSRKSLLKFFRRIGEDTPALLLLALADRFSTQGEGVTKAILEKTRQDHLWLLAQFDVEQTVLSLPPLLNGHDIMALLQLSPGRKLGKVLAALQAAHQLGEISTVDEAKAWVLERYRKNR